MHIGPHMDVTAEDVFAAKDALSRLGLYAYPEWGPTSWPDIPLFDAVKALQKQLNRRPTGEMLSAGPEMNAITAALEKLEGEQRIEAGGGECSYEVRSYTQRRNGETVHVAAHTRGCRGTGDAAIDSAVPSVLMQNPTGGAFRVRDGFGEGGFGARRKDKEGKVRRHTGVDIEVEPGAEVVSPVDGVIIENDTGAYGEDSEYRGVKIKTDTGDVVKMLYVKGSVPKGTKVEQGQPVATAQDISKKYPPNGHGSMTPHVHIEMRGKNGKPRRPMFRK